MQPAKSIFVRKSAGKKIRPHFLNNMAQKKVGREIYRLSLLRKTFQPNTWCEPYLKSDSNKPIVEKSQSWRNVSTTQRLEDIKKLQPLPESIGLL